MTQLLCLIGRQCESLCAANKGEESLIIVYLNSVPRGLFLILNCLDDLLKKEEEQPLVDKSFSSLEPADISSNCTCSQCKKGPLTSPFYHLIKAISKQSRRDLELSDYLVRR